MNQIRRAVILRKVPLYERVKRAADTGIPYEMSSSMDETEVSRILSDPVTIASQDIHDRTMKRVEDVVRDHIEEVRVCETLDASESFWPELIVTVGGDGTFLRASHLVGENMLTPLLGVNSDPNKSFGFFCAANHDTFASVLEAALTRAILPKPLWRMSVAINGVTSQRPVLNDVLFSGLYSADTVKYSLLFKGKSQMHKSSGVWVSTSAGSSAATLSSGGTMMPLESRLLQFRVRELFPPSVPDEVPTLGGLVDDELEIKSRMTNGRLFLDGSTVSIPLHWGDIVTLRPSNSPLFWFSSHLCENSRQNIERFHDVYRDRVSIAEARYKLQVKREKSKIIH